MDDKELLRVGLLHLDNSLGHIMEMKSEQGKALATILHGALNMGETMTEVLTFKK